MIMIVIAMCCYKNC